MSVFEKARFEIWNQTQHPYKHTLGDFSYTHNSVPWVTTLEGVLNALLAANYPNTQTAVNTTADLPTDVDTPNAGDIVPTLLDYRVVLDDGDGKAAGYRWEIREGEAVASWHKIYDMDWGEESILSNFLTKANDTYVSKFGQDEIDNDGNVIGGQYIYGGSSADTDLTLYANSGDSTGANTGFIILGDQVSPTSHNIIDLGTYVNRFKNLHLQGVLDVNTLAIASGSITDTTGNISFGDENLSTLGSIIGNLLQSESFVEMKQILTPANATAGYDRLYFKADDKLYKLDAAGVEKLVGLEFTSTNDNRLVRTDGTTGEAIQESGISVLDTDEITGVTKLTVDNLVMDGSLIESTVGELYLQSPLTGYVNVENLRVSEAVENRILIPDSNGSLQSRSVEISIGGVLSGATQILVENLSLDGNTLSTTNVDGSLNLEANGNGSINVNSHVLPSDTDVLDLGSIAKKFRTLYLSDNISDGSEFFAIPDLMKLKDVNVGAAAGMGLFYDGAKWVASLPDSEIDHGTITGIGDDDHTQYALLSGRSILGVGQILTGGTAASENLTLSSTSDTTKGNIIVEDTVIPSDVGKDLGTSGSPFNNIFTYGEMKGMRLEKFSTVARPASSAANIGRVIYDTDLKQIVLDTGLDWREEGKNKHVVDLPFDGVELFKEVDVAGIIADASTCIIQLLNNNNDFDRIYCTIKTTDFKTIRIETNTPLTVGSYRLIVIE